MLGRPAFAAGTYGVGDLADRGRRAGIERALLEIVRRDAAAVRVAARGPAPVGRAGAPPDGIAGEPIVTDADLTADDGRGTCGGPGVVTGSTPLVGVVLPDADRVVDIRLVAADGYTRIDTRAMLPGPDGLALLALPSRGLLPGSYRIDVTRTVPSWSRAPEPERRSTGYDLCIR
jgi:hypothetical protein